LRRRETSRYNRQSNLGKRAFKRDAMRVLSRNGDWLLANSENEREAWAPSHSLRASLPGPEAIETPVTVYSVCDSIAHFGQATAQEKGLSFHATE
jgi:hypothetical protein